MVPSAEIGVSAELSLPRLVPWACRDILQHFSVNGISWNDTNVVVTHRKHDNMFFTNVDTISPVKPKPYSDTTTQWSHSRLSRLHAASCDSDIGAGLNRNTHQSIGIGARTNGWIHMAARQACTGRPHRVATSFKDVVQVGCRTGLANGRPIVRELCHAA